jgi:Sec-independent protein translocase protein TatA
MFALSAGELTMVAFIFVLIWGAGALPRLGESLAARRAARRGVARKP